MLRAVVVRVEIIGARRIPRIRSFPGNVSSSNERVVDKSRKNDKWRGRAAPPIEYVLTFRVSVRVERAVTQSSRLADFHYSPRGTVDNRGPSVPLTRPVINNSYAEVPVPCKCLSFRGYSYVRYRYDERANDPRGKGTTGSRLPPFSRATEHTSSDPLFASFATLSFRRVCTELGETSTRCLGKSFQRRVNDERFLLILE